jgi:hypothetical protein
MDGDLGLYDVPEIRLQAADTVTLPDFSFWRCAWRAIRRSWERAYSGLWAWGYRCRSRSLLLAAIAAHAQDDDLHVIRNARALERFLARVTAGQTPGPVWRRPWAGPPGRRRDAKRAS